MKLSEDFILREIAGEHILVPTGGASVRLNGLVTLNELGHFIVKALEAEQTAESIAGAITAEYDVTREVALADTLEFLQQLREIGALAETAE